MLKGKNNSNGRIKISVCIPVKNAEWCLPYCLEALRNQTIQPHEYVFCSGINNDSTIDLILQFKKRVLAPVKILYDITDIGTGYARKILTENANGDFISWVDADDIVPLNWIESLMYLHKKYEFDGLEGETEEISIRQAERMKRQGKLEFMADITDTLLANPGWLGRYGMGRHLLKRSVIIDAGNFDPFFTRGQTLDLTYRLQIAGFKRFRCKQLKLYHTGFVSGYKQKGFYRNAVRRSVFLKFFYKYGLKSLWLEKEHTLHFVLRIGLVFSAIMTALCFALWTSFIPFLLLTISGFFALFIGVLVKYGFKPSLFLIQLGECIGEITIIYDILRFKNRKPYGYGKKYLVKRNEK